MHGITKYDLVLRGGDIIDGTGVDRFSADVAIINNRVMSVGQLGEVDAKTVIDISGKVLCPGFIDVHSHDDRVCIDKPAMLPKISQGVTTVVVGNCGISLAPLICAADPIEPLNLLGDKTAFMFADFQSYLAAVRQAKPATNVASLIGHSTLRIASMADIYRKPTSTEMDKMLLLLEEALSAGAIGLSSGVYYLPGRAADIDELIPLVKMTGEKRGIYATHLRDEYDHIIESMHEAFTTAQQGQSPLVISHHKCAGLQNWGRSRETLSLLDNMKESHTVNIDCYPYTAGSSVLDPALVDNKIKVLITWSGSHPEKSGNYLQDIANEWHCTQREAAEQLLPGGACYFQMHEDDVQRILKHPACMIGSDGLPNDPHPHPRLWGTFPRVLGHYARDEQLFSLETAIHKMTGLAASQFGLSERGLIRLNYFADLVVFDPVNIMDKATYEKPCEAATGIDFVFVNGECVWETGKQSEKRPGRVI